MSVAFNPSLKNLVKTSSVSTESVVFKLHYSVTVPLLLVGGTLLSAVQFFGNPISCFLPSVMIFPVKVVQTYCWAEGTFSLPKAWNKTVGAEVPYQGVDKHVEGDEKVRHAYYQWVCFVLLLQALLFLIPHFLWLSWEGNETSQGLLGLERPVVKRNDRETEYKYLFQRYFMVPHLLVIPLFRKMVLCEALYFANVVGQMYLVDAFLGGEFTTYGTEVFRFLSEEQTSRVDPMMKVFPRMAKCTFHHFGPSGDVQRVDTMCLLPLNILNEKIYAVLWFWFVVLAVLTGIDLSVNLLTAFLSPVRYALTRVGNYRAHAGRLRAVVRSLNLEQWFLLHLLGANMDKIHFAELVDEIYDHSGTPYAMTEADADLKPLKLHWEVLESEANRMKKQEEAEAKPEAA